MATNKRIVIVGGGIGGLTAAIALRKAGFDAHVLERAPEFKAVGAGITLQINAMAALDRLQLTEPVVAAGNVIDDIQIQYRDGKTWVSMPIGEISAELGHPFLAIHRARLQETLLEALGRQHVTTGVCVDRIEQTADGVRVHLPDGNSVDGDVLIGADGVRSHVRTHLWGQQRMRPSGYVCWRGLCANTDAWPPGLFVETWGDGQLFGRVALSDETVYWFGTTASAKRNGDCCTDTSDLREEVLRRFAGWPAPIESLVASTRQVIFNEISDRAPIFPWGKGQITLLGDAAHPMTPNIGQGGCQAIEDAVTLAHHLRRAATLEAGLRSYEARRHPRAKKFVMHSRAFTAMAHGQFLWARIVRSTLFRRMPAALRRGQLRDLYRFELDS